MSGADRSRTSGDAARPPRAGALRVLPCLDDGDRAASVRRVLDIDNWHAVELGRSALDVLNRGYYVLPDGREVDLARLMEHAMRQVQDIPPDAPLPARAKRPAFATTVQVVNETSLMAGRRLAEGVRTPLILNFANGVSPGGAFMAGARAQEEVLCRSSGLFPTLEDQPMYGYHRTLRHRESSDWMILSPDVPVFRDDSGVDLADPWLAAFLTAAAPIAHLVGQPRSADLLRHRIRRVLAVARADGYTDLVLGAWGCGAFGNDPAVTAHDFAAALGGEFAGAFDLVVFAVTDWSSDRRFLGPFCDAFAPRDGVR